MNGNPGWSPKTPSPAHIRRKLNHTLKARVKSCSVGVLPNIMEVKGHACTQRHIREFAGAAGGGVLTKELMNGAAVLCDVQRLVSAAEGIEQRAMCQTSVQAFIQRIQETSLESVVVCVLRILKGASCSGLLPDL